MYKSEVHEEIIVLIRLDGLIRGGDETHDGRAVGWLACWPGGFMFIFNFQSSSNFVRLLLLRLLLNTTLCFRFAEKLFAFSWTMLFFTLNQIS